MANVNERNVRKFLAAQREGMEVAFSYVAKSDGHTRVVVGEVEDVTDSHLTLWDRVRDSYRVFIVDRIFSDVLILSAPVSRAEKNVVGFDEVGLPS